MQLAMRGGSWVGAHSQTAYCCTLLLCCCLFSILGICKRLCCCLHAWEWVFCVGEEVTIGWLPMAVGDLSLGLLLCYVSFCWHEIGRASCREGVASPV